MRRSICILALLAAATFHAPAALAAEVRVEALDCEFRFPAGYVLRVGADSRFSVRSGAPLESGQFVIASNDIDLTSGFPAPESSEARGPLTVERFAIGLEKQPQAPPLLVFLVKGQAQQMRMSGVTRAQAESYVAHCLDTMDPAVLAVSQRRAKGCKSRIPLDAAMQTIIAGASRQPVFSDGLIGWRIYDIDMSGPLWRAGIRQGMLLTHICGVPAAELQATSAEICCDSDTTREVNATFRIDRQNSKSVAIDRGT